MSKPPFYAGTYNGRDYIHQMVGERVVAAKKMTEAQCLEALKLPGLQKTVSTALNRRLMELEKQKLTEGETP